MNASHAAMLSLLVGCSSRDVDPTAPAGVTILPVDPPPPASIEPESTALPVAAPPTVPEFQVCECDGSCQPTPTFVARKTEIELVDCEKRRGTGKDAAAVKPRDQRVLDCFFAKSGARLQLCPVAPQKRPDFDGYLRGAVSLPRSCFDSARVRGSVWGGTEVSFRLDGGGYAQDIRVDSSDARLQKCVADELKKATFMRYAGDVARVRYRLVFDMPR